MLPNLEFGDRGHAGGPDDNQHVGAVTGGPDPRRATYPHFSLGMKSLNLTAPAVLSSLESASSPST